MAAIPQNGLPQYGLLIQSLFELPISILTLSSNGTLVSMNQLSSLWFRNILSIGDDVTSKLIESNNKNNNLNLTTKTEGYFQVEEISYRYICDKMDYEGIVYFNVCVFNDTRRPSHFDQDDGDEINVVRKEPSSDLIQDKFETTCCMNTGLGFLGNPNSTMIQLLPDGGLQCSRGIRGYSCKELVNTLYSDHIHPDDVDNIVAYHESIISDTRQEVIPISYQSRKTQKNGSYVHVETIGAYKTNEKGEKSFNGIECVLNSDRMENLLSYVTDQVPCGVIMVNTKSGMIEMCNPNATNWLNIEKGKHFTKSLNLLENTTYSSEEFSKLQLAVMSDDKTLDIEVTVRSIHGRVLSFACRTTKQFRSQHSNGYPIDTRFDDILVWIINDITAISNAMEEKHSAIIKFMRCTSHDMRTPMQAISLAAHSLSDDSTDPKGDIDTIISSSAVLETIMSNILEFKTISCMKLVPIPKPIDVREVLYRLVNMLNHSTLINNNVKLTSHCEWAHNQCVYIDRQMFDRIILNLVTNALKFTQKGFVKVTCSLESRNDIIIDAIDDCELTREEKTTPVTLKLVIEDTGCGMNETALEHVGELGFLLGEAGGFGLGTFIVRTYIQALHGNFNVKSTVDLGTTIIAEMPVRLANIVVPVQMDGIGKPNSTENSAVGAVVAPAGSRNKYVLVVEDVVINRKLLVKSLTKGGFEVDQAENGLIALRLMLENNYNTVFMDINMPVMNGDVAVREYWKQCDPTLKQHPKIIMLTGNITDADREMALACGAHEFLTKPVVPKQLWAAASVSCPTQPVT